MTDEPPLAGNIRPVRKVTDVTLAELDRVDLEAPIATSSSFTDRDLGAVYRLASQAASEQGQEAAALTYGLLQAITEMHFKPGDRAEPFGPLMVRPDGSRTLIPSDIAPDLAAALAAKTGNIQSAVLRARLADVIWTNNPKHGQMATVAFDAYCDSVEGVRAGKLELRDGNADVTDHDVVDCLRRACHIASLSKGKEPLPDRVKTIITATREDAYARQYRHGFMQSATLDIDFAISDPAVIARQAETLNDELKTRGDGYKSLALLELAGRAFRAARDKDNEDRVTLKTAESCVQSAADLAKVPFLEAHWLTRAIAILGRTRAQKARRNELRKQLIDVQARMMDEFTPIGHTIDIREIVEATEQLVSGKPLADALLGMIWLNRSADPVSLREQVMEQRKKSILSSLFSTSVHDKTGKLKFQSPGLSGADEEDQEQTLRFEIIQAEDRRRKLVVGSTIEPARQFIEAEHRITVAKLLPLIEQSPFIEPGYELVFAQGLSRWFNGDPVSGTSILVPQLENALRYILRNAGHDVSTMKNDGTQEDRSIQALFDQMREELVEILGEPIVYEIENLFLFKAGPGVRHAVAHGQFSTGHFFGDDASYACWLVYQLCFLPLIGHWKQVTGYLEAY